MAFVNNAIFSVMMIHVVFNQKRLRGGIGGWGVGASHPMVFEGTPDFPPLEKKAGA